MSIQSTYQHTKTSNYLTSSRLSFTILALAVLVSSGSLSGLSGNVLSGILGGFNLLSDAGGTEGHHEGDTNDGEVDNEVVDFSTGGLAQGVEENEGFDQEEGSSDDGEEGNSEEDADGGHDFSVAEVFTVFTDDSREGGGVDGLEPVSGDVVFNEGVLGGVFIIFTVLEVEFGAPFFRLLDVLETSNDEDDDEEDSAESFEEAHAFFVY